MNLSACNPCQGQRRHTSSWAPPRAARQGKALRVARCKRSSSAQPRRRASACGRRTTMVGCKFWPARSSHVLRRSKACSRTHGSGAASATAAFTSTCSPRPGSRLSTSTPRSSASSLGLCRSTAGACSGSGWMKSSSRCVLSRSLKALRPHCASMHHRWMARTWSALGSQRRWTPPVALLRNGSSWATAVTSALCSAPRTRPFTPGAPRHATLAPPMPPNSSVC
mmetsp:Transcript_58695/g.150935  ORF Transcript_58695/g.150935 Transcript_58695/m.150935 type:complete len:224 (+) Transcript_58695:3122-3793(+)